MTRVQNPAYRPSLEAILAWRRLKPSVRFAVGRVEVVLLAYVSISLGVDKIAPDWLPTAEEQKVQPDRMQALTDKSSHSSDEIPRLQFTSGGTPHQ